MLLYGIGIITQRRRSLQLKQKLMGSGSLHHRVPPLLIPMRPSQIVIQLKCKEDPAPNSGVGLRPRTFPANGHLPCRLKCPAFRKVTTLLKVGRVPRAPRAVVILHRTTLRVVAMRRSRRHDPKLKLIRRVDDDDHHHDGRQRRETCRTLRNSSCTVPNPKTAPRRRRANHQSSNGSHPNSTAAVNPARPNSKCATATSDPDTRSRPRSSAREPSAPSAPASTAKRTKNWLSNQYRRRAMLSRVTPYCSRMRLHWCSG
mmetsp:Transcript_39921/g.70219  ORF Transcript_39921/g.70219 Transcript_39921/m.70219 type:complete len:258 (-) Transcript_39921:100-873(-)